MNEALYFIALVPPEPIYIEIMGYKQYFADTYNSKAALKSPPHVTLHMPFKLKEKKETSLITCLKECAQKHEPFNLELQNFGVFDPRVIYVNVINNQPLTALQKSLQQLMKTSFNIFNTDYRGRPFHPHMTVAFRDLKKSQFELAWNEFKEKPFQAQYTVENVTLLKHNGKMWEEFRSFDVLIN